MNTPCFRNIGIYAHIDAGGTTLTERILAITSKVNAEIEAKQKSEPTGPTVGDRIAAQRIEKLLK